MKKILTFLACFYATLILKAQQPTFSHSSSPYQSITGGTSLTDSTWIDLPYYYKPIGFNFNVRGIMYDSLAINDGFIEIFKDENVIELGYSMDLIEYGFITKTPSTIVVYKTSGTSPNKIFEIEWKDAGFENQYKTNGILTDKVTFKITLYENDSKATIHTGASTIANTFPNYEEYLTAFATINNSIDYDNFFLEASGDNPVFTDNYLSEGLTSFPSANKIYTFTFPKTASNKKLNKASSFYYSNGTITAKQSLTNPIHLYDISGKLVQTLTLVNNKVDITDLKAGVYTAKTSTENGTETLQFIK